MRRLLILAAVVALVGTSVQTAAAAAGAYCPGPSPYTSGRRVRLLVAVPVGVTPSDTLGPTFEATGVAADAILATAPGAPHIRYWCNDSGTAPKAKVIHLPSPADPDTGWSFVEIIDGLQHQVAYGLGPIDFTNPNDDYVVAAVVDAPYPAWSGIATGPVQDESPIPATNANNTAVARYAAVRSITDASTTLHEIAHLLGAVQLGSPHSDGGFHCSDGHDVMCISPTTTPCPLAAAFDCGHDDYFNPNPAPGSYLATHWNLADSAYLTP